MKRAFRPKANWRKPTRTKTGQRINLLNCIMHRDSFTEADIARLAAGYGHTVEDVRRMVDEELQRRRDREALYVNRS